MKILGKRIGIALTLLTLLNGCASLKRFTGLDSPHGYPITSSDVITGMSPESVRTAWGEPARVQKPVDSEAGYERWIYQEPTRIGYSPTRIVYFEGGRVAGWETSSSAPSSSFNY
jgi:hypothetical protein